MYHQDFVQIFDLDSVGLHTRKGKHEMFVAFLMCDFENAVFVALILTSGTFKPTYIHTPGRCAVTTVTFIAGHTRDDMFLIMMVMNIMMVPFVIIGVIIPYAII